jgi:predicted RNase H-like HicB family nuclease
MHFLTLGGKRGTMTLHSDLVKTLSQDDTGEFALNVIFREISDDGETYFVAECLEIPGCISEGTTKEEAEKNIEDAMRLCVSVMLEDCMKKAMENRRLPDLTGVSSQRRLCVSASPNLEFATA